MEEEKRHSIIPGVIFILVGLAILLAAFGAFRIRIDVIWTYIVILIGIVFWFGFITDRTKVGNVMPGTVLLTVGLLFNYCVRHGWDNMSYLWPFFILAPAFGFYALYLFGGRDRGVLIPAGILTILGVIFLLQSYDDSIRYIGPIALIVIGALLIFRGVSSGRR
ncbi:MAG: hypothetical protein JSV33_11025 [bacterium]|nr:MAG: hypothetical protein JSV33_11025 [bacterium]